MKPVSPVIPGSNLKQINVAEHQEEYETLPVLKLEGKYCTMLSRWRLTWRERLRVLITGNVYHHQMTFGSPLQPVFMEVAIPHLENGTDAPVDARYEGR